MTTISMNIAGSRGPLNDFPMVWEFENIREFIDFTREEESMLAFIDWAHMHSVSLPNMRLYTRIDEGDLYWEFVIMLKNVREFKKYLEMGWQEIDSIVEAYRRDKKINEILDEDDC